jgi:hypothetical protein
MKPRDNSFTLQSAVILFTTLAWTSAVIGAPSETALSVFVQPTNPKEGCDPFFPKSSRPYIVRPDGTKPELSELMVKGISIVNGKKFVIINNHTFGVNDFGSVITPKGQVYIHVVEINADTVIVESNGQRQTLRFSSAP